MPLVPIERGHAHRLLLLTPSGTNSVRENGDERYWREGKTESVVEPSFVVRRLRYMLCFEHC